MPTPALLTSTSRRPKRSRWARTTACTTVLVAQVAGDRPRPRSPRRAAPWRPPRASPAAARRRSARSPPRPSTWAIASPMPLEAPVTIAARCPPCVSSSVLKALLPVGAAFHQVRLALVARVRLTLCIVPARALALAPAPAAARSGSDDSAPRRRSRSPTAQPADFPSADGQVAERPGVDGRAEGPGARAERVDPDQGHEPLRLRALRHRAQADHGRRRSPSTSARTDGSGLRGPFVARSESLAVKPQFQSQTTAERPRRAPRPSTSPTCRSRRNGKRIVIGARQARRAPARSPTPLQHERSATARPGRRGVGEQGDRVHTQTLDRRRRRRQPDRHAPPRRQGPAGRRLRRRARQEARRHHVRHAAAVPEPRLRPGGRRRRAGQGEPRPRTSPSSTRRSTTTTRSTRAAPAGGARGACRPSRGRS